MAELPDLNALPDLNELPDLDDNTGLPDLNELPDLPSQNKETGFFSQIAQGASTPFQGDQPTFDEPTKAKARKLLEDKGYKADSLSDTAVTGIMSLADTLSFGQLSEIRSAISDVPEDVYEAALQLRQEDSPWSSMAGTMAGYVAPGLGAAKAARAAIKYGVPAAQAVVMGGEKTDEGQVAEGVARAVTEEAIAFTTFGLMGKAFTGLTKGKSPKSVKDELLDEGLGSEQADEIIAKAADHKIAFDETMPTINQLSDAEAKEFEKVILGGQKVEDYNYGDLDDALDVYRDMLSKRQALLEESGLNPSSAAYMGMKMMDAQFVGNMSDRRYGTGVGLTMNSLSRDSIGGLWEAKDLKAQAQKVIDDLGIDDPKKSKVIVEAIDNGREDAPQELIDLFASMRKRMNDVYEENGMGKNVIEDRGPTYVPHYTKRAPELIATLRNRIKNTTGQAPGSIGLKQLEDIKADTELMDSLKYVGGYMGQLERKLNDQALIKLVRSLNHTTEAKKMMDVAAASVKERLNETVPPLIQETDIGRLLGGWIDSVTSDAAMRKNLMKLRASAQSLKEVDPQMAAYINNYVTDVSGGSRKLAGWAKSKTNEFSTNQLEKALEARDAGQTLKAQYYEAIAETPQVAQFMQAQLYPYFLGLRVDGVARNMTQPYLLTIPEIGGDLKYISSLVMNSIPNSVRGMFAGESSAAFKELAAKGWLPPDPTPGQFQSLRKGVQTGGKFKRAASKLIEKANNIAMYLYQQSDIANRVVTLGLGKKLGVDALAGNVNALQYIQRMPPAYRAKTLAALKAGDKELVTDTILDHLMAATQFNYNRASMSEYGREFGSAFSQFSKWPTAIGADIFDGYDAAKFERLKGGTRLPSGNAKVLKKYLGPYLMLVGASRLYFGEDGPSPREKQMFSADPASSAPLTSVLSPASDPGRAFTPPVFQAIKEFLAGEGVNTTFGLLPLAAYGRFLVERMPAWMEDERGQKPSEFIKDKLED